MRFVLAAVVAAVLLVPARARACGVAYRTSPYENLLPASASLVLLDLIMLPAATFSRTAAKAEIATAALSAASFLALGFSPDVRSDGLKPTYLGLGFASALLVAHGIWMSRGGERPALEISGGSGLARGTAGAQVGLRFGVFGAHLGAGLPLTTGNQGVSGGVSWVGRGAVAPLVSLNAALQILPDCRCGIPSTGGYESRSLMSFSLDVGVRLRPAGGWFVDLAAGPIAQLVNSTAFKPWVGVYSAGWMTGAPNLAGSGAWPLPLDIVVALGREI